MIVYIDRSDIRTGKLDKVTERVKHLAEFVEKNNPKIIDYRIFIDDDPPRMTVVAVHPDSDALEFHMQVGNEEFRKFAPLLTLRSIEVFGRPSDLVMKQLREKADLLGEAGTVSVQEDLIGFSRRP